MPTVTPPAPNDRPPDDHSTDAEWLERSLDRWYVAGIVMFALLLAAFPVYAWKEPGRLQRAREEQRTTYVTMGARIYETHCVSCHGENGGGGRAGPTLRAKEYLDATSQSQTEWAIAGGRPGTAMNAWGSEFGGTLTSEEVRQVTEFIRSFAPVAASVSGWKTGVAAPPLPPPSAKVVLTPAPSSTTPATPPNDAGADHATLVADGAKLFTQFCSACHLPLAGGAQPTGPILNAKEYLAFASDQRVDSMIVHGNPGTAMIGWSARRGGPLTDLQVRSLVMYIRSMQSTAPSVPTWRLGRKVSPP